MAGVTASNDATQTSAPVLSENPLVATSLPRLLQQPGLPCQATRPLYAQENARCLGQMMLALRQDLPLTEALTICAESSEFNEIRECLSKAVALIEKGVTPVNALVTADASKYFPDFHLALYSQSHELHSSSRIAQVIDLFSTGVECIEKSRESSALRVDVRMFLLKLSCALKAGLNELDALKLARHDSSIQVEKYVLELEKNISHGKSIAQAFGSVTPALDLGVTAIVRRADRDGRLDENLYDLATHPAFNWRS